MAPKNFYPNACYVCKKYGEEISLRICPDCHLISYCDVQHQLDHSQEHQTFCVAMQRVFDKKRIKERYMNTEEINESHWSYIKLNYMKAVSTELKRPLSMNEEQIIALARACAVCYRQDTLIACNICPDASFCTKHINEKSSAHAKNCKELKLYFDIDAMLDKMELIDVHKFDITQRFSDMITFVSYCVPNSKKLPPQHVKIYNSEYLTKPLTLFYAINQMNLIVTGNLIVHVIAAHFNDDNNIHRWEILLHLLPPLISLTIISIGPDLVGRNYQTVVNLCDKCIKMNKKITYEYFPTVYRDYVRTEDFKKPDVIIGFNILLREFYDSPIKFTKEWRLTAQALMAQNCPYILTVRMMPEYINYENVNFRNCYRCELNPFRSIMPSKNILMDACYTNLYVIIYKNVKDCQILVNESDFIIT